MKANPVGWFEIYVQDMERAKKFYQAVLHTEFKNLTKESEFEMWAFPMDMTTVGATGSLVRMAGFSSGSNSVLIYFKSDDCSVEENRVVAAGGKIQKPKTAIGEHGFITLAKDSEGNMFGIHSMK